MRKDPASEDSQGAGSLGEKKKKQLASSRASPFVSLGSRRRPSAAVRGPKRPEAAQVGVPRGRWGASSPAQRQGPATLLPLARRRAGGFAGEAAAAPSLGRGSLGGGRRAVTVPGPQSPPAQRSGLHGDGPTLCWAFGEVPASVPRLTRVTRPATAPAAVPGARPPRISPPQPTPSRPVCLHGNAPGRTTAAAEGQSCRGGGFRGRGSALWPRPSARVALGNARRSARGAGPG